MAGTLTNIEMFCYKIEFSYTILALFILFFVFSHDLGFQKEGFQVSRNINPKEVFFSPFDY